MKIVQKTMLIFLVCCSATGQLLSRENAWYPGKNVIDFVAWIISDESASEKYAIENQTKACNYHRINRVGYQADCDACNKATRENISEQKQAQQFAIYTSFYVNCPCDDHLSQLHSNCSQCRMRTEESLLKRQASGRAAIENQTKACCYHKRIHLGYQADCDACNTETRDTISKQKQAAANKDIPCESHKKYQATCDACNQTTREFNRR